VASDSRTVYRQDLSTGTSHVLLTVERAIPNHGLGVLGEDLYLATIDGRESDLLWVDLGPKAAKDAR
jgi:hypothetical protein